jgi:hypothetical protein
MLTVRKDGSATLAYEVGNGGVVYTENTPHTESPIRAVTPSCANGAIYLPSELAITGVA